MLCLSVLLVMWAHCFLSTTSAREVEGGHSRSLGSWSIKTAGGNAGMQIAVVRKGSMERLVGYSVLTAWVACRHPVELGDDSDHD